MFKKILIVAIIATTCLFAGCELSKSVALAITKTSGTLAVAAWCAIDNPDTEVKTVVTDIVSKITTMYDSIGTDDTYVDVVYPQVTDIVDNNTSLSDAYKVLVKSGVLIILTGIDELLASNEDLKEDRDLAREYVSAFCSGVSSGLSLTSSSATMQRAAKAYSLRMQLQSK